MSRVFFTSATTGAPVWGTQEKPIIYHNLDPSEALSNLDTAVIPPLFPGAASRQLGAKLSDILHIDDFGATGDSTTSDTAALVAAMAALDSSRGGTIVFGRKRYRCDLTADGLVLPNDGAATPNQKPICWLGQGAHFSGEGQPINGSTVLDFRGGNVGYGKVIALGLGLFDIEGITFTDGANGQTAIPYIYTTNATLQARGNAFMGSTDRSGTSCDQDAIVCGGTIGKNDGTLDAGFQGYGTVIERNYFNRIRRFVYGRTYFNASTIRENVGWTFCGGTAAIELKGTGSGDNAVGNKIDGNLIEGNHYTYGIKLADATNNLIIGNGVYDGPGMTATVRLESTCIYNTVIGGLSPVSKPYLSDAGSGNRYISMNPGESSFVGALNLGEFGYPSQMIDVVFTGGSGRTVVQPAAAINSASIRLFQIKKSALESSNAGAEQFAVSNEGGLFMDGTQAGNITNAQTSGTSWSNNGRKWAANSTGGNMEINSGSGGSFLDMKHFSTRFFSQGSTYFWRVGPNNSGIAWGTDSTHDDIGIGRNAAGVLEVNSGTTGTFRDVKARNLIASGGVIEDASYTVATLPAAGGTTAPAGSKAYASNGRKSGEGAAAGTGIPVWCDGTTWRTFYDNSAAAA